MFSRRARPVLSIVLALGALVLEPAVEAAALTGTVDANGKPVAGAIVSAVAASGASESAYTDARGHFTLTTGLGGDVDLRVRKRYFRDDVRKLDAAASQAPLEVHLVALTDAKEISEDHPSLSYFSRIKFDADEKALFSRPNFTRDCLSCHSLGNRFTRWPRPPEGWVPTVTRMHGYLANADKAAIQHRAELLAQAFDGSLVSSHSEVPFDPMIAKAKIYEWKLPGTVVPHDAEYSAAQDKVYIAEMFAGEVVEVNLKDGALQHFRLPDDGMPAGGEFTKRGLPAPYGLTISRAPHSLAEGADGKFYLTDSIGAAVTSFDPKSHAFANFAVGNQSLYPHTVHTGKDGVVWFTIAFSNQVGRFDPKTKDMKVVNLPATPSLSTPGTTIPYGIDISPKDGSVWYSKLASDKIGRIDPKTLEVKEYDSPVRAPRRQRFDAQGRLWVAGFSDGAIARIDVEKWDAKIYKLPVFAAGEIPAPYALSVNPKTQEVWVNDTMLDLVWRFLPKEERFVAYPLPMKGTYTRDVTYTKDGWACTANNPIPPAALEGNVPELICIDPLAAR
jgi:streptogramin lyase